MKTRVLLAATSLALALPAVLGTSVASAATSVYVQVKGAPTVSRSVPAGSSTVDLRVYNVSPLCATSLTYVEGRRVTDFGTCR